MSGPRMRVLYCAAVLCGLLCCVAATRVRKCDGSKDYEENPNIRIANCAKLPCALRRKSSVTLEWDITPQHESPEVQNRVSAMIVGIPFPFIGVDGKSTCSKYVEKKTGEKAKCPLKPGVTYTYKDGFEILQIYPRLKTQVKWALVQGNTTVDCMILPVRIV